MKILLLYTYNQGFLSKFYFQLSSKLVDDGYEVFNFSLKPHPGNSIKNGVKMHITRGGSFVYNYFKIFKIIMQIKPDVIISNFSYANPALIFGRILGVKNNIAWFHSLNEQIDAKPNHIYRKSKVLKLADTMVANSHLTKNQLNEVYDVPLYKIVAIPFWTDMSKEKPSAFKPSIEIDPNTIKIGCPGRLAEHKNQKIVIEALTLLHKQGHKNFRLFIAGDGEKMENLKNLALEKGIEHLIEFAGHLSAETMISFYRSMDVIVLPSLFEAFGMVFIESIALGTPVIVSNSFGALTFIKEDELNDFTFDPKSAKDLCDKLEVYFKGQSPNKETFLNLYNKYYDSDIIYKNLKSIILKSRCDIIN